MNFKVNKANLPTLFAILSGLGAECAGIITKVGSKVINLSIGDRVLAFNGSSFSTSINTTTDLCAKIPDTLSFEDAATMLYVYSTVIHGLQDITRLEAGQIYATGENEERVEYLVETFDIPRSHIFNSRNASFLPDLMRENNGRGVDVVLNSLSGDLLHSSWACVAEYGKMVEIGKRDLIGQGRLAMDLFTANRSFFGVDLSRICAARPLIVKKVILFKNCMHYFREGAILPIRPTQVFDAIQIDYSINSKVAHLQEAFSFMRKIQHIGKIVISMPSNSLQLAIFNIHSQFSLCSDVSYLLVGGLG
ncbi:putative polyketide synthase protein [Botrytis fragariae]|uniref:Putative polyketide synthase protein n=1 Tax=Botrytis fragariae TaxID=1964551 RepID=A0A8H6ANF1_9HELO|nr:putative polyketide synthase protein [Botrytis fragariae]KAF5870470.1 putative polyketide synthase protein [Botrytis fragariae]